MKKMIAVLSMLSLLLIAAPVSHAAVLGGTPVKVVLNGKQMNFSPNAVALNGNTMVPFRQLFESYGAEVNWNQKTKEITAIKDQLSITMTLNGHEAYVNGERVHLTQAPLAYNNATLINLRFVSEALGGWVVFDKANMAVNIKMNPLP